MEIDKRSNLEHYVELQCVSPSTDFLSELSQIHQFFCECVCLTVNNF